VEVIMPIKSVYFSKMNEAEYNAFCERTLKNYADDLIRVGYSEADNALSQAREQFNRALPEGFSTSDARFYSILNNEEEIVGALFILKAQEFVAAIADFIVYEKYRGKGYALQALKAIEEELKQDGYKAIILNVFEDNIAAKTLYEKFGFIDEPKAYSAATKQLLMVKRF